MENIEQITAKGHNFCGRCGCDIGKSEAYFCPLCDEIQKEHREKQPENIKIKELENKIVELETEIENLKLEKVKETQNKATQTEAVIINPTK